MRRRHPEWWIVPLAVVAWLALAAIQFAAVGAPTGTGMPATMEHAAHMHGGSAPGSSALAAATVSSGDLAMAGLMAIAMMAPVALPMVRHVTIASLWPRRTRSAILYLVGYLAVWTVVGVALSLAVAWLARITTIPVALAVTFLLAASWQVTRRKQWLLQRCARTTPLAPAGLRADVACVRFGVVSAVPCVATCWGFMAAAAAAGHLIPVMGALFALQMHERTGVPRSRTWSGAFVAALGVAVVAVTVSTTGFA
jgi:predicted metal-binding membrane protein